MLPEAIPPAINTACTVLAASKPGIEALLEQAARQRSTPERALTLEAQRRGLL
jgi:hypothetical protein